MNTETNRLACDSHRKFGVVKKSSNFEVPPTRFLDTAPREIHTSIEKISTIYSVFLKTRIFLCNRGRFPEVLY